MQAGELLYLVDGDISRRAGISHSLSSQGIHVEPFEDVGELMARWPQGGVVLVHDDGNSVLTLLDSMVEARNWLPVIAFAEKPAPRQVVRAIQDGAIDYLDWPPAEGQLALALAEAARVAAQQHPTRRRENHARNRIDALSPREREVLTCIAGGMSNRMIGEQLSISPRTVEIHRSNMMTKMGASHISEAIRAAFDAALV